MNKIALKNIVSDQRESLEKQKVAEKIIARNGLEQCRKRLLAPNVLLISGMRRAGKSMFAHLLAEGRKYAFISFDDERLIEFKAEHFQLLMEAFNDENPLTEYFLFDEIQNIKGWELFINRIRPGHRVIVTGSNANLMSSEMATHLTGRYDEWALFPMSFDEFLRFKNVEVPASNAGFPTTLRTMLGKMFEEYLYSGGIFEGYSLGKEHLRTLFRSILTRDILGRYRIGYPSALEQLASTLINSFGHKISLSKIGGRLGLKSSHTVKEYLGYLEATFLFFTLNKFSYRIKEQDSSLKKVFCCDNGLVTSLLLAFSVNTGRFLENLVAIELKRREKTSGCAAFYWDDYRHECDFVVKNGKRVTEAYQVCAELTDDNRDREIRGLCSALDEFKLDRGTIITTEQEDEIQHDGKTIHVTPAWRWMLK